MQVLAQVLQTQSGKQGNCTHQVQLQGGADEQAG